MIIKSISLPFLFLTCFSMSHSSLSMEELQRICNTSYPCYYDGNWKQLDPINNISYQINYTGNMISSGSGFSLGDNLGITSVALSLGAPIIISLSYKIFDSILYWCDKNIYSGIPSDRKRHEEIQGKLKELNVLMNGDPGSGLPPLQGSILYEMDPNSNGSIANIVGSIRQDVDVMRDPNSNGSIANIVRSIRQDVGSLKS
jgi:hypothetical protein